MASIDELKVVEEGDAISAAQQNIVRQLLMRGAGGGLATVDSTGVYFRRQIPATDLQIRHYTGTTSAAVTAGTSFYVTALTATDGGSLPATDATSPNRWTVQNSVSGGDGYTIAASAVIKIIGYSDGSLHPFDAPCP
jgi:hypothetical protein